MRSRAVRCVTAFVLGCLAYVAYSAPVQAAPPPGSVDVGRGEITLTFKGRHTKIKEVRLLQHETRRLERLGRLKVTRIGRPIQQVKKSARAGKAVYWLRKLRRVVRYHYTVPPWPWGALASCESGQDWTYNGRSGYDGGLQFAPSTWSANRFHDYPAFAYQATPRMQVLVAIRLLSRASFGQWPSCSSRLGLR